jgi:hypothetical protein
MQPVLFITGLRGRAAFWDRQVAALKGRFNALLIGVPQ